MALSDQIVTGKRITLPNGNFVSVGLNSKQDKYVYLEFYCKREDETTTLKLSQSATKALLLLLKESEERIATASFNEKIMDAIFGGDK